MNVEEKTVTIALVGNPNSGKTTLSNELTGSWDSVGNYPRVTVAMKSRQVEHRGWTIRVVDLPGIYSLSSQSPEERIGREFIQNQQPDIVLNVIDAGNIDRNLFLSTQLIEMGRPRIYALNMVDEMRRKGWVIDTGTLSTMLGGPIVETVGNTGHGIDALLDAIVAVAESETDEPPITIPYDDHLEVAIRRAQGLIAELHPDSLNEIQTRWLAIKLLEGDDEILRQEDEHPHLMEMVRRERYDLARTHGEDSDIMFANARYGFIHGLLAEVRKVVDGAQPRTDRTRQADGILLHRVFGLPLFLGLMWLMFEATFSLGQYPADWVDAGVASLANLADSLLPPGLAADLVVDGIITGAGAVIVFLPFIVILFFFIALFSESGYLARSAFLVDRLMHAFGLHGKAFIPLIMGFGCNVPAVMATRTIESPRARLIAILINPFMCCSQRLPAVILFSGAFFAEWAGSVVFAMYLTSITVSMGAAIFLSKFVVRGGDEPFVMELPPYRIPTLRSVLFHMWEKAYDFVRTVGGVILIGSIVVWFLQAFPRDIEWSTDYDARIAGVESQLSGEARAEAVDGLERLRTQERTEKSYLGRIGHAVAPVFGPLGFGWRDTVAIITGVFAKEVVVASYAVLYAPSMGRHEGSLGLRVALAGSMAPVTAIAFMVFLLLYSPCLSTIAVIRREAGSWRWAGFSVVFSLCVAWFLSLGIVTVGGIIA